METQTEQAKHTKTRFRFSLRRSRRSDRQKPQQTGPSPTETEKPGKHSPQASLVLKQKVSGVDAKPSSHNGTNPNDSDVAMEPQPGDGNGVDEASSPRDDSKNSGSGENRLSGDEDQEDDEKVAQDDETELDTASSEPRRDLWAEAWDSDEVGEEKRRLLQREWEDEEIERLEKVPEVLVNGVVELTQEKLATYTKQWGSDIKKTASGTARSILLSALTVKDLVDAGLKFDPTGYGSSAWTVVSFGLKLVQNDKENMDLTFEACGFLANLMAKYSRMEAHYWKRRVKDAKPLEDAMIKVYIAVLLYSAAVKESLECSIMHRIKKSFISLTGQPLIDLKSEIAEGDKTVEDWQNQIDRERRDEDTKKLEDIQQKADNIVIRLENTETVIEDVKEFAKVEDLREMFKWLFNENSAGQHKTHEELRDAIKKSEGGDYKAGKWLLERAEYLEWKKYPQSLLWLFGNSGCGKSSLCSTIIQSLGDSFDEDDTKVLMHWYFRFYLDETKRIDLLLRSLLRQLGSRCGGFPDDMLKWLRSCHMSGRAPKTEKLFEKLNAFIPKVNKDVFVVLDGLDEFPEDGGSAKRSQLLDLITKLAQAGHPNLHILLVSKDERDIRLCLENKLSDILVPVDVKGELNKDLDNFIQTTMNKMKFLTPALRTEIERRLHEGEERNFLWATSLLSEVANCQHVKDIPDMLERVPRSIVDIYEAALKNVTKDNTDSMKSILIWLLRQLRPLTRDEIAAAVGLAEAASVTHICTKALVESRSQIISVAGQDRVLEILRFAHFSAKEYLESVQSGSRETQKPEIARFEFSNEDAHLHMTRRCLEILSAYSVGQETDADARFEDTRVGLPLLQYAAEYWFKHYQLIDRDKISKRDLEALDEDVCSHLQPDSPKFTFWLRTYDPDRSPATLDTDENDERKKYEGDDTTVPSPVYYAVKLGVLGNVGQLITQIEDIEILDRRGREGTTLQLVAHGGHFNILKILLGRRVDVNAQAGVHGTALYAASARGDKTSVEMLLEAGAKPHGTKDGALGSSLHVAAFRGHDDVIRVLIEKGHLPVDHSAGLFSTALQAASASRKHTAVKLLLELNAEPNVISGCLGTAVQAALSRIESPQRKGPDKIDKIVDTLRSAGAQYLEGHEFWTAAYRRAYSDHPMSAYINLFQNRMSSPKELEESQRLLVSAIRNWTLPGVSKLINAKDYCSSRFLGCKIPFHVQLENILRGVPKLETSIKELSRKDFMHKALFWAGINHIFEHLEPLLDMCFSKIWDDFRYYPDLDSIDSPSFAFRWAFSDPGLAFTRGRLHRGFRSLLRRQQKGITRQFGLDSDLNPMDQSDLVAIGLIQQKQKLQIQEDVHDVGRSERLRDPQVSIVWVLSDLLSLVRDLLHYGNRCVQYHDAARAKREPISEQTTKAIEDLTFELFSAVIRLATSINDIDGRRPSLSRTVKLLQAIRLERISDLDVWCEKQLAQMPTSASKDDEICHRELPTEIVRQIQGTITEEMAGVQAVIARQLNEWQPSLVHELQTHVSAVVKNEATRVLEQVQKELHEKIRQEVQRQLLGAETASLPDKTSGKGFSLFSWGT